MNFYKLIKQQYEYFKSKYDILPTSCEGCPCKALRYKVINPCNRTDCTNDIIYLVNKYKIDGVNIFSCDSCMRAAVRIAKKMSENINRI